MSSILFTHSYFLRLDPKQWKAMQPYPPLATLYAAALLRQQGHAVQLHDTMFEQEADGITKHLQVNSPKYVVLYDDGFNYLTKMCLTNMRKAAFRMIQLAKQHQAIVIVSSSDATDHYQEYLDQGADYVIIGEAEITLSEVIKGELPLTEIAGLVYKENTQTHQTAKREVLRILDELPMPAWDLVDMEAYKKHWIQKNGYFSLNMVTTRGCPYKCNWCAKPIYGNRYNSHSPERVATELAFLSTQYKPDHIWFCDDIFGLKPGWIQEFAQRIKEKNISFRYKIQSRVDLLVDEHTVHALAESGCETVWLGAESGSQKILDAMDKGIKIEQIQEARKLLKRYDIQCAFFLQFGYLGETTEDVEATLNMVLQLMPDEIGISVSYPLPGTSFYDKVKNQLEEKTNWSDSDEMAMLFRSRVHPQYYKSLQRYVHKTYQKRKGIQSFLRFFQQQQLLSERELRSMMLIPYYTPAAYLEHLKLTRYARRF
ncbi:MAG: B12-binding radical protein [Chitinophagaceae bacterium]|nr:B12-binding radical protein [Chitinophagaceae bacterium]